MKLLDRLFLRISWFYKYIIKESDPVMVFYFTAFAISFIGFFYLNFLLAFLYVKTGWNILKFERIKYTVLVLVFLFCTIYAFFKNRDQYEEVMIEGKRPSIIGDFLVFLYLALGLFLSFYTFIYLENNA